MKNLIILILIFSLSTPTYSNEDCNPIKSLIDLSFLGTSRELARSCPTDDISEDIQVQNCQCLQSNPASMPLKCSETRELEKVLRANKRKLTNLAFLSSIIDEIDGMDQINSLREPDQRLSCEIKTYKCNDDLKRELNEDVDKYFLSHHHEKPFFEEIDKLKTRKRAEFHEHIARMYTRIHYRHKQIDQHRLKTVQQIQRNSIDLPTTYEQFLSQQRCQDQTSGCSPEQLEQFISRRADIAARIYEATHRQEAIGEAYFGTLPSDELEEEMRVIEEEQLDKVYEQEIQSGRDNENEYFEGSCQRVSERIKSFCENQNYEESALSFNNRKVFLEARKNLIQDKITQDKILRPEDTEEVSEVLQAKLQFYHCYELSKSKGGNLKADKFVENKDNCLKKLQETKIVNQESQAEKVSYSPSARRAMQKTSSTIKEISKDPKVKKKLQDRFENFRRDKTTNISDSQVASIDPSKDASESGSAIEQGAQQISPDQQIVDGQQQSSKTVEPEGERVGQESAIRDNQELKSLRQKIAEQQAELARLKRLADETKARSDKSDAEREELLRSLQAKIKQLENKQAKTKNEIQRKETEKRKLANLPKPSAPIVVPNVPQGRQSATRSSSSKRSLSGGSTGRRSASSRLRPSRPSSSARASYRDSTLSPRGPSYQEMSAKDFALKFKESKQINVPDYLGDDGKKKELTVVIQENGFHQVWEVLRDEQGEISQYILLSEFNSTDPRVGQILFKTEEEKEETVSRKPASKRQSFKVEDLNNLLESE